METTAIVPPSIEWIDAALRDRAERRRVGEALIDSRRDDQNMPLGDWRVWLLHPGRGWGKGFAAAAAVGERVRLGLARHVALVGSTQAHVRDVMVENPLSGVLRLCPGARYVPSLARVEWPNGAIAHLYSAEKPDRLRGPEHDTVWADEVDSWGLETSNRKAADAWTNIELGLRLGDSRMIVTSTPKPGRMVSELLKRARDHGDVTVTTGSTYDNAPNLSPEFIANVERRYKGTRLERQEIYGQVLEEIYGALWTPSSFRYREATPTDVGRCVVGVDPSGGGDAIGILAAGEAGEDWIILDDWSIHGSPDLWARRTAELVAKWGADCVVAERNYGGDMVESTLRAAGGNLPVKMVTASRGKHVRAEPVSLLYDQGRVWHRRGDGAQLDLLEDELRHFTTRAYEGEGSPDRADAMVWAMTELAIEKQAHRGRVAWTVGRRF